METEIEKEIREVLKWAKEKGLYPEVKIVTGGISSEPEFFVNGKKVLSFNSANYLGLANDEEVKKAIIEGLHKYGIHPSGSPLISGTLEIHRKLEKEFANFLGKEEAMIFATSTMANMGVIPALINLPSLRPFSRSKILTFLKLREEAVIFSDEFNHMTIIEGCRLAKAKKVIYKHCDVKDLERKLKKYRKIKKKLIITDGVFSSNGRIAPLREIVNLAKKYSAMVYVDDAVATGILGKDGGGTAKHFGVEKDVDIIVTTFSKCFGIVGGIAAASREIIEYLRGTVKTYIFSGAYLGALAMGVLKGLEIVKKDKERKAKLWENTIYLKNKLEEAGFNTLNAQLPLIPVVIGDEKIAIEMARDLFERGILAPPFRWPAVPKGQALMRFTVTCRYTKEQLDRLVENLIIVGKKYKIIK